MRMCRADVQWAVSCARSVGHVRRNEGHVMAVMYPSRRFCNLLRVDLYLFEWWMCYVCPRVFEISVGLARFVARES
jgi:hypothetical protein